MDRVHIKKTGLLLLILPLFLTAFSQVPVDYNPKTNRIKIQDHTGNLVLNIDCNNRCIIDHVETFGNAVVSNQYGVFSSVKCNGTLYTTSSGLQPPVVTAEGESLTIEGIVFGEKENPVSEKWIFRADTGWIDWTIERTYKENTTLEDTGFPEWSFNNMNSWTGALLGTGGVAWCRFFDKDNASLGSHTGKVTFWNQTSKSCLSIDPSQPEGQHVAVRFSRQPDNRFTLNYTVSDDELRTKHFLARFINDRQDIWDAFDAMGTTRITYRLRAMNYDDSFSRGDLKGISNESVRAVLNTIARVGVIDEKLMGSNNWHLDMGFVCLHEQWVAQMGLAIDDEDYFNNYRKTLDFFRDNAIATNGNVKDRWAYRIWDSKPGTFGNGFYECQWGDLLDANTDYVINVSELFHINGDTNWVRSHKTQCEKALSYLIERDSDHNGLIEAYTDSHTEKKGSDWIDVIWASWENAFINAKFYYALTMWAAVEQINGDIPKARYYRDLAEKCKYRFNQPLNNGGFWSGEHNWYVYWRDRDGSVHGDNLVTPVNFMAIAYGICDDAERKKAVLDKIEGLMDKEQLFMWPINFFPYQPDEGYKVNYPFPNYENGDIFLAWGEVGIRAYQDYDPAVAVKYVKNVLKQYEKDGLACQRYTRGSQEGSGSDILANNCLPVVGLYRDIYGIQPQYDRLFLDPHLTNELNGTLVKYKLRNQYYNITLSVNDYSISSNSFTVSSSGNFGIRTSNDSLIIFKGKNTSPSMVVKRDKLSAVQISILNWDKDKPEMSWKTRYETDSAIGYDISVNEAGKNFDVLINGKICKRVISDSAAKIHFDSKAAEGIEDIFLIEQKE